MSEIKTERLTLRRCTENDRPYLTELLVDGDKNPAVQAWWDDADDDTISELIYPPADWDFAAYAIYAANQFIGLIQYEEEPDPKYRHAGLDIAISDAHQGKGYGPEALEAMIEHLRGQGHHRIMIDPSVRNTRAIATYERLGFTRVGVVPKGEFDHAFGTWQDTLLMVKILEC